MALETVVVNLMDFFLTINYIQIVYTSLCKLSEGVCAVPQTQSRPEAATSSSWGYWVWVCRKTTMEESSRWKLSLCGRGGISFLSCRYIIFASVLQLKKCLFHLFVLLDIIKSWDSDYSRLLYKGYLVSIVVLLLLCSIVICIMVRMELQKAQSNHCSSPTVCSWNMPHGRLYSCSPSSAASECCFP